MPIRKTMNKNDLRLAMEKCSIFETRIQTSFGELAVFLDKTDICENILLQMRHDDLVLAHIEQGKTLVFGQEEVVFRAQAEKEKK